MPGLAGSVGEASPAKLDIILIQRGGQGHGLLAAPPVAGQASMCGAHEPGNGILAGGNLRVNSLR